MCPGPRLSSNFLIMRNTYFHKTLKTSIVYAPKIHGLKTSTLTQSLEKSKDIFENRWVCVHHQSINKPCFPMSSISKTTTPTFFFPPTLSKTTSTPVHSWKTTVCMRKLTRILSKIFPQCVLPLM